MRFEFCKREPSRFLFLIILLVSLMPACAKDGFLTTRDQAQVFYESYWPRHEKGVVVLLHGWSSSHNEWANLRSILNENGWSTIAIDFRGHGISTSTKGNGKKFDFHHFTEEDRHNMLLDVDAAVRKVEKSPEIWLMGSSFGAKLALVYAAGNPNIRGVALFSPAVKYNDLEFGQVMSQYGNRPILLVASENDPRCFAASEKLYAEAKGPKKFIRHQYAGHGVNALLADDAKLKDEILKWLGQFSSPPKGERMKVGGGGGGGG